ncbi:MAG: hypothetical protein R6W93_05635 [Candidatus Limnocylindrales bacterium]
MAKRKGRSRTVPAQEPRQLRKQLRKAEAGLHKAEAKRDRAQARVDALGIIADEIRAQLADLEKASAKTAATPTDGVGQVAKDEGTKAPEGRPADGDGVTPASEAAPDPDGGSATPNRPRRPRKTQPAV